jgi:Zn-dependent metalloprotease
MALAQPTAAEEKERRIFDAKRSDDLPGALVRAENDPPSDDPAVNEAYDGSGGTYDFFGQVFDRNSIDDNGMRLDSTVHYREGYDNAFWDGQQMVYGDGDDDLPEDERLFERFTKSLDIIGHELAHGVTQHTAALAYHDQPGALNESMSDVFGSLVKQWTLKQTASEADWLIGGDLLTDNVEGDAIRSMKAPGTAYDDPVLGKDPQPGHMNDYVKVPYDHGGVHINSGIPNHAFFIVATELGGNPWEKAGQIWYVALRDKLRAQSGFQEAAKLTIEAAGEIFGSRSLEQKAVEKGWAMVGVSAGEDDGCVPTVIGMLGLKIRQPSGTN